MKLEMLFSGIGGQGIMILGELLCCAASKAGHMVTFQPFYGQEKRGGRTMCYVVISEEMESPIFATADVTLVMDEGSLADYKDMASDGGTLIINSSLIKNVPKCDGAVIKEIPFYELAEKHGEVKAVNMVALGYLFKYLPNIPYELAKEEVKIAFANRPELIPLYLDMMDTGYNYE